MQQKRNFFWIIIAFMLTLTWGKKHITFQQAQCSLRSKEILSVECAIEDQSAINLQVGTSDRMVNNLVGTVDLNLSSIPGHKTFNFRGFHLDLCKILKAGRTTSLLALLSNGILQSDNNLPKKCPFNRNTTYVLRHLKFDANFLPQYVEDYNFEFFARFFANRTENLFDVRVLGTICNIGTDCTGAEANRSAT